MTLENCKRLLKHFEALADGTISRPVGHKDWQDVVYNAKLRAEVMKDRIARKMKLPKYAHLLKKPTKTLVTPDPDAPEGIKEDSKNAKKS